ncbi:hypothetical protein Ddye_018782 [Dipteronia dyeriana]|uniref:MADS-box domain-containing protein n=1 Tax=Dipteronia dyeriana TaxID=168575 RepID=A0AAD9UBV9_9ROSI|nr:hypothetical protein Ddye_018782 [Dipteronia dyeriana]
MTRTKVNLSLIVNDSPRKASLKKRTIGLLKKVSELSTLCCVEAFVIIYSPYDREPVMWPTRLEVQEILARFQHMPEMERNKKMENQETYLQERVSKLKEQLNKQQMKNEEMKVSNLMHNVCEGNGLDDLNVTDLESLVWFAKEKHKLIVRRLEFCQHASLLLAHPLPLPDPVHDQASALVMDRLAPNLSANNDNHENAPSESSQCEQWFINMMNNINNITSSSKGAKTNHEDGLSSYYQPFAVSSNSGNQLRFVGPRNNNSYFVGSSGAKNTMGLHPFGDFRDPKSTCGIDMSILLPSPPLPPHFGGSSSINDFFVGMRPHREGFIAPQGNRESDMTMALSSSHFEGRGSGSDIALSLQPYDNVEVGGNVITGDMGSSFELFRGNIATSDVGLPYDITKQ